MNTYAKILELLARVDALEAKVAALEAADPAPVEPPKKRKPAA